MHFTAEKLLFIVSESIHINITHHVSVKKLSVFVGLFAVKAGEVFVPRKDIHSPSVKCFENGTKIFVKLFGDLSFTDAFCVRRVRYDDPAFFL